MTVVGGVVDLGLGVLKIIAGYAAASQALIADGVHSMSDLATDVMVIWAAREASRAPDADHPYGHQRIETLATTGLGVVLALIAFGIVWDAGRSALAGDAPAPGITALVVAGVSVFSKEAIFRYTMHAARRLDSELLRSNAWHSRSDALSSVVVIVGVTGAIVGYNFLDAAAAVVVALMILWVSAQMIWRSARELIDTGIQSSRVAEIERTIRQVRGVRDLHELRTRRMGNEVYLDGHVLVDTWLSVSEGHRIAEAVRRSLRQSFPEITDVTIHVDAEDDETYQKSAHLPLRQDAEALLAEHWRQIPEAELVRRTVFHYLEGRLHVEIHLPLDAFASIDAAMDASHRLRQALAGEPRVGSVQVLFG